MPHTHANRRTRQAAAVLLILPAALGLAACGGSSKGSSSTTNASATTANGKGSDRFGARAAALRTCLQKEGITLPKRPAGSSRPGTGGPGGPYGGQPPGSRGPFGGGPGFVQKLPKGVSRAKFEAALKKCGGNFLRDRRGFDSAQGRQRFAKFAQCMRSNGVKLPAPNTSGKGPIFDTKGIDTNSATFKAADTKCAKELRPQGAAGAGGGPPAGEGAPPGPGASGPAPEGPPAGA